MKTLKSIALAATVIIGSAFGANAQILYKVEKPGSEKTSYILGTHHFAPLAVVDSIAELPEILAGVDKLYGEIDMSVKQDPAAMMQMQQVLVAPADSTLDKVMTPAQLETLGNVLSQYTGQQMLIQMFYPLKPAAISSQLMMLMAQKVFPAQAIEAGIDMTMQTRARELGKPVGALETMEFQTKMLFDTPISAQAADLVKTIENPAKAEAMAVNLSNAYLNHDIKTILDLMLEEEAEDEASADRLIYSRNAAWISQLAEEMPNESLMIVVGAAHLPGDRGVLAGLEKNGFTVTPIK